ncbi:MAG TPA: hypothetical protein VG713_03465, partial [Pirellulales bacterium]|nr:hypothetical protein [Pirellulales bacterium]
MTKKLNVPPMTSQQPSTDAGRSRRSTTVRAEDEREHDESSAEELEIDEFDEEFDLDYEQDDTDMRQFEEELNAEENLDVDEDEDVDEFEPE